MSATIIQFSGVIERVSRRMVQVMEAPDGEQREDAFFEATTELGVVFEGGGGPQRRAMDARLAPG